MQDINFIYAGQTDYLKEWQKVKCKQVDTPLRFRIRIRQRPYPYPNFAVTPLQSLCCPHLFKGASRQKLTPKKSTYLQSSALRATDFHRGRLGTLTSCYMDMYYMWLFEIYICVILKDNIWKFFLCYNGLYISN